MIGDLSNRQVAELRQVFPEGLANEPLYRPIVMISGMNQALVEYEGKMKTLYWGHRSKAVVSRPGHNPHTNSFALSLLQQPTTRIRKGFLDQGHPVQDDVFLKIRTKVMQCLELGDDIYDEDILDVADNFQGNWCYYGGYLDTYSISDDYRDLVYAKLRFC